MNDNINEIDIFAIADMLRGENNEDDDSQSDVCPRCNNNDNLQVIQSDLVCTKCGTVVSNIIDNSPEWNNYADDSGSYMNNSRCVYSSGNNDLFNGDMDSVTNIVSRKGYNNLSKWHRILQISPQDRALLKVYMKIDKYCNTHSIPEVIIKSTKLIYKNIASQKLSRGNVREAMLGSCLFYSFIEYNYPRTIVEISKIIGKDSKKINKTNKMLGKMLWEDKTLKNLIKKEISCHDYIHRFGNKLNLDKTYVQHVSYICSKIDNNNEFIGRDPSYKAALAIYIVAKQKSCKITKDDICKVCNISSVTLNKLIKNYDS